MTKFQAITLIIAFAPFAITGFVFSVANPQLLLASLLWMVGIVSVAMAYILLVGQQTLDTHAYHQCVSAQPVREMGQVKEAVEDLYEMAAVSYPREAYIESQRY